MLLLIRDWGVDSRSEVFSDLRLPLTLPSNSYSSLSHFDTLLLVSHIFLFPLLDSGLFQVKLTALAGVVCLALKVSKDL